jgi:glycosyltransferase involved in cell wall biosynthesis
MITIVTANKNGGQFISALINSLNNQTSRNFKWLVIDGISTDNSLALIKETSNFKFKIISQQDFSIYHALNIAIDHIDTEYYCVSGCDDFFDIDFIKKAELIFNKNKYDLIFGSVISNNKVISPILKYQFLSPVNASHSIGTIIKKSLHNDVGNYSKLYPVLADKKFVIDVLNISNNICYSDEVFGTYSQEGFSSLNSLDYLCDLLKLQIKSGRNIFIQTALFFLRAVKIAFKK